jgi:hypothetical protein
MESFSNSESFGVCAQLLTNFVKNCRSYIKHPADRNNV